MNIIFAIFRKEMIDALRDRRTLMVVLFSSLLMVPLMLMIFPRSCHRSNRKKISAP